MMRDRGLVAAEKAAVAAENCLRQISPSLFLSPPSATITTIIIMFIFITTTITVITSPIFLITIPVNVTSILAAALTAFQSV